MPKLKAEFRKPKLTLYNTNYVALGVLTNRTHLSAHNIVLNTMVNETPNITFDIPAGGLINSNSTELLIKHKNDFFVIKEISVSDSETTSISVSAEHIACELKGILVGYFEDMIGETPQNMWNTVMDNSTMSDAIKSRYVFETNIVNTYRYLGYDDEKSVFEYLVSIAQQFDACLLFETDADGKIHINLLYGDINRNRFIRKGKDLKQLDLKFNTESLFTKLTPFGATDDDGVEVNIMDVNDGKSYLTDFSYYLAKGMTQKQIDENPLCNQECIYRNDEILDESELLRLAKEELKRVSTPVVEGSISAIDLHVFEGGLYLSPILCERIIVVDKDIEYSLSCKITSVSLNYDNPLESQIGISNVIRYSSTLKDLVTSSEIVDKVTTNNKNGKPSLDASKVKGIIDGHITQLKYSMENNITDVTSAVILFENRVVGDDMFGALALGSRGLLISRELDKVTNQWVWSTALDSKGLSTQIVNAIEINGSQIKGNIISSYDDTTWINLDNGTFNFKDKIKYVDGKFSIAMKSDGTTTEEFLEEYEKDKEDIQKDIDEVYEAMNTLKDTIDDVINDGIITESELATISNAIIQLNKEKDDMVARYNNIKDDNYLSDEISIKLNEAFNNYIDIHNVLVSFINTVVADKVITETEKGFYEDHSTDYSDKLSKLSVEIDNALSDILENSTTYQVENLKTSLEKDFEDVYDKIDEILDDVGGVIVDGIIDEAELLIIKNTIIQLDKEKEDVDMSYSSIYNNSNLNGTFKTNLEKSYTSYTTSHTNLKNVMNNMVADGEATDQEKTEFDTATKNYSTALANFKKYATLSLEMITKDYTDAKIEVLEDSISLKVSGSDMEIYVGEMKLEIEEQLDGKIETYYQMSDPSKDWDTSDLKEKHKGDIWYDELNNVTYRWNGSSWLKLTDADAELAKILADSKAKVFTTTPIPPYNKGDLWVQGSDGDIMRCNTTKTTGSYVASDWVKASKYTDDTKVDELQNLLKEEYYTIKETDAQIKIAKDSITSTVSSTYITKDEMGNTLKEYAKSSELTQTEESITAKFSEGGTNLIKNGCFNNGLTHWTNWGSPTSRGVINASTVGYPKALMIVANDTNQGVSQTIDNLEKGKSYTLSAYLNVYSGQCAIQVKSGDNYYSRTSVGTGKQWISRTFTAQDTSANIQLGRHSGGSNGTYYFTAVQLERGEVRTGWTPNANEIYEGITTIDKDGITVSHSQVSTKSQMNANGFFISDQNGDVIAELSSANQWSTLKADEVFANNIERVYMGDANLYVDHSKSTDGTGTSSSPFNSFASLVAHFESKGIILNKDVTVSIVCTSKNIAEQLYLQNLKGNGILKIQYNASCVHRNEDAYNIILDSMDCHVWITGGRSSYNTSDGAILAEGSTSGHGMKIVGCKNVVVEAINVSRTNWGLYVDRSHVRARRVDFCNTWCPVEAVGCSHVSMEDCCGNAGASHGGDAMRAKTGSMIIYGDGQAGSYVPYGKVLSYGGGCWKLGSPAQTASFKTVPSKPATTDRVQTFTSSGYGYYSVGQACWNPNGQKVYQGDWGYGNNKGIYLLPNSSINSFYSGGTIIGGATIKLSRANSGGYSSAQNVYLCGTTATAVGSGSNPPVTKSYGSIGTLAWGETKTFTLPSAFCTDLKAGTIKSIMFYTSDGSNYILFGNSCTLTLKCNK